MNTDDRFEARARELLEQSAERLDGHTRSRLTRARVAALEEHERAAARPFRSPGWWLPSGALAAAALLAVAIWVAQPEPTGAPVAEAPAVSTIEDIELLASVDSLDLYEEEAAFYVWAGELDGATVDVSG